MFVKIYSTVKNADIIRKSIDFGEGWINLRPNDNLNINNISIMVYSIGHPTSKGMTSFYGDMCRISIYTGSTDGINSVLETIFHEMFHVKQYCSKRMSVDPDEIEEDENEAALNASLMLEKFEEFYNNDVDK